MTPDISLETKANMATDQIRRDVDKAGELVPDVKDHFNSYVENTINPILPDGYEFVGAKEVVFDKRNNKFNISTGGIKTPDSDGLQTDFTGEYGSHRARIGVTVVDKCYAYEHENNWAKIIFGFEWKGCLTL